MAVEIGVMRNAVIEESVPVIVGVTTSRSAARQNRERKKDRSHQVVTWPPRRLLTGSHGKTPVITQNKRHSDPPLSERFVMHEADGLAVDVFGPQSSCRHHHTSISGLIDYGSAVLRAMCCI